MYPVLHSANRNTLRDSEFMSVNKTFGMKAKLFTKENNAKPKQKSSVQSGAMQKLNKYFCQYFRDRILERYREVSYIVSLFGFQFVFI